MNDNKKAKKVRTSMTIDPELLARVRASADNVSSFVEAALKFYIRNGAPKEAE